MPKAEWARSCQSPWGVSSGKRKLGSAMMGEKGGGSIRGLSILLQRRAGNSSIVIRLYYFAAQAMQLSRLITILW
jgi:hypothetical protein